MRPLVVVAGTGTAIGKTHTACALLRAAGPGVVGLKPVESGVTGDEGEDGLALRLASDPRFHVKPPRAPYLLRRPVSPHLAAAEEGLVIGLPDILRYVALATEGATAAVVELAGGLFTPLARDLTNADVARGFGPGSRLLLVAPDRLGVLNDVTAALRAYSAEGGAVTAIAVVAPSTHDASTGTNAQQLAWMGCPPVFAVPRAAADDLARRDVLRELYAALFEGARDS